MIWKHDQRRIILQLLLLYFTRAKSIEQIQNVNNLNLLALFIVQIKLFKVYYYFQMMHNLWFMKYDYIHKKHHLSGLILKTTNYFIKNINYFI